MFLKFSTCKGAKSTRRKMESSNCVITKGIFFGQYIYLFQLHSASIVSLGNVTAKISHF